MTPPTSLHEPVRPVGVAPVSPAEGHSTLVDGVDVVGALSPSRASDFLTCPLLYRFRSIDRLPEPSSPAQVRGTVVHKVLETLFDLPALERTPERAEALLAPAWEQLCAGDPGLAEVLEADGGQDAVSWLAGCRQYLRRWFDLEDPTRLEPAERESYVEAVLDSRLLLRGFIDRLDVAPDGRIRVVDYKTGRSPGPGFEAKAMFQMRFYALVLWRARGVMPTLLQLVYLGNGEIVRYEPDEDDLLATERKVTAIWRAIASATSSGEWQAKKSKLCGWCSHQALCPEFGGTPPLLPTPVVPSADEDADALD
ncbi:RecB family exonuclease [Nocardioides bruguierae]|uniref:PD-(D/E)XK nuclease family protein n=1 Tax=Nocardioides bruguierae TaxID=2945102 RepID=A0A9X2D411_9ACTN|nr:PD-(D/E)XK nuclease family protein [Nocardioides bruguierae]MCM0618972.1 PD-(D/E)XK nuclease family protein [Nocardioides bruguierae]